MQARLAIATVSTTALILLADAGAQTPADFVITERDRMIQEIESWESVLEDWERRARTGSIESEYEVGVVATFEPGEARFEPQPGGLYFYENLDRQSPFAHGPDPRPESKSSGIVVGDARSMEVIAHHEFAPEMFASVHTTVMSPDGKYLYIVGPRFGVSNEEFQALGTPGTLIKVDALTLQPVSQMTVGGRIHHGQIFQDRYILFDTFAREEDGLDVFLFDPVTEEIVGGVRDEDLGGGTATAFTDGEYIYALMEPAGYGPLSMSGYVAATNLGRGRVVALRPFWVAKIDPRTWEVVREYPYPGYRGDWIEFDAAREHMFIPAAGSGSLSKINLETGEVVWHQPTGVGPYGAELTADESEVWVADKGEAAGFFGRTITVFDNESGRHLETLFAGYSIDHVLLSPNGREMWATSNRENRIYVFNAETRERMALIDMPTTGGAHGLVWVHYDEDGNSRVIADQGGFHNGINPRMGRPLDY